VESAQGALQLNTLVLACNAASPLTNHKAWVYQTNIAASSELRKCMNDFHARQQKDMSDAVVFSFDARWKASLLENQVGVFFRRRVPKSSMPRALFFYMSAPISSIIGSARIGSIASVTKTQALQHRSRGCISESELTEYMGDRSNIYMISISSLHVFQHSASLETLSRLGVFHPPQTFCFLSKWGVATIRELGDGKL
jgi:predicted transcriptional regulator